MEKSVPARAGRRALRILGLLAGISNALFWIIFGGVASLWQGESGSSLLVRILAPGLLYAALVVLAFWKPREGGWLLILTGIVVTVGYPILYSHSPVSLAVLIFIAMALPPLVAGGLFLAYHRSTLHTSTAHGVSPEIRGA